MLQTENGKQNCNLRKKKCKVYNSHYFKRRKKENKAEEGQACIRDVLHLKCSSSFLRPAR